MKHSDGIRDHLIEAASRLFAANGYDGTSVRAITSLAKTNLGAITYHFGSKEALYHAVIERFAVPFADRLAAISAHAGPPLERIADVAREFLDTTGRHPEMPALILRELASDRPLPEPVARVIRRNLESLGRIIGEGQRDGTLRAGEPQLLALSVAAQPLFIALASRAIQHALSTDPKDPAVRARIAEHVVATVVAGLANSALNARPQERIP